MTESNIEGNKINVLDHGFVRLVDHMGSDISVVRAARVSYDAAWRAGESEGSDTKLINYLWRNKHTSPFESVGFTFEVKAPIFVFRQWHRHRTWSYNELSGRYKELSEEYYLPDPKMIGEQATNNKQGRALGLAFDEHSEGYYERSEEVLKLNQACKDAFETYKSLLSKGWPRELARSVLPVNTYSHMFCSVNLLNLLKFITLRDHDHAQYEIRVCAEAMKKLIEPIVPVTMKAFNANS